MHIGLAAALLAPAAWIVAYSALGHRIGTRMRTRSLWSVLLLLVPAPGLAQAARGPVQDVVVQAPRASARSLLWEQVRTITGRSVTNDPLPRFQAPICIGAIGLPGDIARIVLDRMIAIAEETGIEPAGNPCEPNVVVIFADGGRAELKRLATKRRSAFASLSHAELRRLLDAPGPAQAWNLTEVRSRDGDPLTPGEKIGDPPRLSIRSASRISSSIRQDMVAAAVVIERQALIGKSPQQIAAYAAMRTFVRTTPPANASAETILSLFEEAGTPPVDLTTFDRAILRGVYKGASNDFARTRQAEMVSLALAGRTESGAD